MTETPTRLADLDMWPLRTERLVLRPATHADLPALWHVRRTPEAGEWGGSRPATYDEFAESFTDDGLADQLLIERDGEVIGDLLLQVGPGWAQREVSDAAVGTLGTLGWVLHPDHWGHGHATEAVRALIDVAFGPLGLHRVIAECFADNEPSWRLMERIGMRREAHNVKDSLHRDRGWINGYVYALLAEEWPT
ncbi:GNAT family N-acetyltransferase [Nocardioides sp. AE5]|uniref:GNAT family N-acetyltransferase n=1 Tax=Nocardioides sp. AE5 TaxID=2962573 RepID=UPI002881E5B2|nr:GNAT family N-acetyltransferase [Nocardioides sp. AE5]MDT0202985.1 GNAT family N-acetyltransferase [Nocardioides sp. AE5]